MSCRVLVSWLFDVWRLMEAASTRTHTFQPFDEERALRGEGSLLLQERAGSFGDAGDGLRGEVLGVPPWPRLLAFLIESPKLEMKSETLLPNPKLLRDLPGESGGMELLDAASSLSCSRTGASHESVSSSVTVKRESTSTCGAQSITHPARSLSRSLSISLAKEVSRSFSKQGETRAGEMFRENVEHAHDETRRVARDRLGDRRIARQNQVEELVHGLVEEAASETRLTRVSFSRERRRGSRRQDRVLREVSNFCLMSHTSSCSRRREAF